MIKLKRHIIFVLFGIYFFPILFQPAHVVWHHLHGYHCEQHFHRHIKSKNNILLGKLKISETEKTCPICAYEFAINDLAKLSFFNVVLPVISYPHNESSSLQYFNPLRLSKTPRAPPIQFS